MIVRTCLLISDDPDDHIEFSEALYEISDDSVLVTVSDIKKAIDLITLRKCVPEVIFLNLNIPEFNRDEFFDALTDDSVLRDVKVIAFGEFNTVASPRITTFLANDMSYSELKNALKSIMAG